MANVPGFTGVQDWKNETCDLSSYAGQTVYLSFRDVKNVVLGGTTVSDGTSLASGGRRCTRLR
jgi:hypothetical protein